MRIFEKKLQQLEHALRESYYDKEHIDVGSRWKMEVMRKIRQEGLLNENTTWLFFVNQFGWRFVTAVCAVVLIVSVYAGFSGFNLADDEIRNLFLTNPVEFTVAQMLK